MKKRCQESIKKLRPAYLFMGCILFLCSNALSSSTESNIYSDLANKLLSDKSYTSDTIAVCPLNSSSSGLESFSRLITERLTNALVASKKCVVVERSNLNQVLSEAKIGLSGIVNQETAAKIGNLIGAKRIITGNVEQDESEIHIIVRLINVETGQIESSAETSIITSFNIPEKIEQNPENNQIPKKSLTLVDKSGEDENRSQRDLVLINLENGIFINIDKQRSALHDKIAVIEEREKTEPGQELSSEKNRLNTELRACDIMIRGIDAFIQNGERDTFQVCLKQAKELSPHNTNLMLLDALLGNGDVAKRKNEIDEVLSISTTCAEGYLERAYHNDTYAFYALEKKLKPTPSFVPDLPSKSQEEENKLLNNVIHDVDLYALYSGDTLGARSFKIYVLIYRNKEKDAETLIKKAVAENPANYVLYGVRAQVYRQMSHWDASHLNNKTEIPAIVLRYKQAQKGIDKAIEDYSTMIALDPNPSGIAGRYKRAELYRVYKEDYVKAIADLTILIQNDPSQAWKYLSYRGSCYKSLGQKEEAVKDLKQAHDKELAQSLEKEPEYAFTLDELSEYYLAEKDSANAFEYLDEYISVSEHKPRPDYLGLAQKILPYVDFLSQNEHGNTGAIYFNRASQFYNRYYQELKKPTMPRFSALCMLFESEAIDTIRKLSDCLEKNGENDKAIEILNDRISMIKEETDYELKTAEERHRGDGWVRCNYHLLALLYEYLGVAYGYTEKKQYEGAVIAFSNSIESCDKCLSETSLSPKLKKSGEPALFDKDASYVEALAYWDRSGIYKELEQSEKANADAKKACSLGNQDACDYLKAQGQ